MTFLLFARAGGASRRAEVRRHFGGGPKGGEAGKERRCGEHRDGRPAKNKEGAKRASSPRRVLSVSCQAPPTTAIEPAAAATSNVVAIGALPEAALAADRPASPGCHRPRRHAEALEARLPPRLALEDGQASRGGGPP
jgi:hypothetical protein